MKQPELGKRIAELRQSQGLTQEELVERCNINVRTIQRIEAGEVTPRNYTIKSIFDALGASLDEWISQPAIAERKVNKTILLVAMISAIVYFFTGLPEGVMDYIRFTGEALDNDLLHVSSWGYSGDGFYIFIKLMATSSYALLMLGFYHAAVRNGLTFLRVGALTLGIITIVFGLFDIISLWIEPLDFSSPVILVIYIVLFGIAGAIFSVGLFSLRKVAGDLALVVGAVELAMAFCLFTFFLSFLALFLTLPAIILEIILLYQLYSREDYSSSASNSTVASAST